MMIELQLGTCQWRQGVVTTSTYSVVVVWSHTKMIRSNIYYQPSKWNQSELYTVQMFWSKKKQKKNKKAISGFETYSHLSEGSGSIRQKSKLQATNQQVPGFTKPSDATSCSLITEATRPRRGVPTPSSGGNDTGRSSSGRDAGR